MNSVLSVFLIHTHTKKSLILIVVELISFHFNSGYVIFEEADLSPLGLNQSPDSSEIHTEDKPYKKEGKKMSLHRKSKPSRRTTSLLDLFFSSSLGMFCCQHSSCLLTIPVSCFFSYSFILEEIFIFFAHSISSKFIIFFFLACLRMSELKTCLF